jgi:hypothetical protein
MVWISESLPFKHSYSKATLWIYFISSSFFSPLPPMSVLVDLCLFFVFSRRLRISLYTGASWDLCWTWWNHRKRHWTNFSSIGAYPNLISYIIIIDSVFPCMTTDPLQHPHLCYTHFLNVLSFSSQYYENNRCFCPLVTQSYPSILCYLFAASAACKTSDSGGSCRLL